MPLPPPIFPSKKRVHRKRRGAPTATTTPINMITSVVLREDQVTTEVFFSPGTVVTAVGDPDGKLLVTYDGRQTSANFAEIIEPGWVRFELEEQIDPPATWQLADVALFTFETGVFAGPTTGDVIFPE